MPSTSSDALILYFVRSDTTTSAVYVAVRGSTDAAFSAGEQVNVGNVISPQIARDGNTLYWYDYGASERKIYAAKRSGSLPAFFDTKGAATTFQTGVSYAVSADERTLYYSDPNANDILRSTRASTQVPFQAGIPLANVNSTASDMPLAVSDDDCVLYLRTARSGGAGGTDIWVARRP
jgi:hypothetical protein